MPPVPRRETAAVRIDDPEAVIRRLRAGLATSDAASEGSLTRGETDAVVKAFNDAPPVDGRRWHCGARQAPEDAKGTWRVVVYLVDA